MFGLNAAGQRNFDISIACPIIIGAVLGLRLYCKIKYQRRIHADDYWIALSAITAWASASVEIYGTVHSGKGGEMDEIDETLRRDDNDKIAECLIYVYLAWMFYLAAAFCVKLSVLLFYRRVFVTTIYQRLSLIIIIFVSLWYIASTVAGLLACIPLADGTLPEGQHRKCFNTNIYTFVVNLFDALSDVAIMVLPMRMVFSLHVAKGTKFALYGLFALAGLVVVTNFLRVGYMYQPDSKMVRFDDALLWTNIHLVIAHLCACLPIYKPLWTSLSNGFPKFLSRHRERVGSTIPHPVFLDSFRIMDTLKVTDPEQGSSCPDEPMTRMGQQSPGEKC